MSDIDAKPVNDFNVRRFTVLSEGQMVEVVSAASFDQLAEKFQQLLDLYDASLKLALLAVNTPEPDGQP